ncbi:uncharacterized protein L203_103540 [Cryptococcus depauperatus CBS 7841]|uniref:Uncharacterized protein n=1 Tax=Cryptococcus depauperatus CBS 7841 TaxID=1295531 RepID=A0AAJ8M1C6_9TREE
MHATTPRAALRLSRMRLSKSMPFLRSLNTPPKAEELLVPSISELMSRRAIKNAWAALSTTKKMIFGLCVLVGGAGEFMFMRRYILEPARERKRLKEMKAANDNLNTAGGDERAMLDLGNLLPDKNVQQARLYNYRECDTL